MKLVRLWVPICVAAMVIGCGQKGPLVLPDAPKHKKTIPRTTAPTPAPASPGTPGTSSPTSPSDTAKP
jgi:predicted small lipoprotein YifL